MVTIPKGHPLYKFIGTQYESVLEEYLGVDLPDDQVNKLVEAIKAKVQLDKLGSTLGGLFRK